MSFYCLVLTVRTFYVCVQRVGVLNVGQRLEEQNEFEKIYKNGTAMR